MIQMYKDQLAEAHEYVKEVQEILKKIGAKQAKTEVVEKEPKQVKKRGRKPSIKVVEKAEPKKRGRKPKVVLPPVVSTIATKSLKKLVKNKVEAKPAAIVARPKVVVEKKPDTKPVAEMKPVPKSPATIESVVGSLLTTAPKKAVKKVTKKISPEQRRLQEMAASAKLSKPFTKKASIVKSPAGSAPVETKNTIVEKA